MCKRNTLVEEKCGVISFCENCGIVDLTYGNFSMQLTEYDFKDYYVFINQFRKKYANKKDRYCRDIKIKTLLDNLQLMLCYKELEQLHDLMSTALLILQAERMVN